MKPRHPGPVVAIGELLWDLLPAGPRLGGTTANFAIGCARLGRPAALVTCVGADQLGRDAVSLLSAETEGLPFDFSLIQTSKGTPTGTVSVLLGPDGHPQYGISTPSAWDEIQLQPEARAAVQGASALCFGTLAQREPVSRSTIRALVESAGNGCVRIHDVNVRLPFCSEEVVRWSLLHADIVKISEEELAFVCGLLDPAQNPASTGNAGVNDINDIEAAARVVLGFAPACRLVAITRGPLGSVLVNRDETDAHPGFPVQVEDTVGAGDAFTAGMAYAYLQGAPLAAVNRAANLCGSYVASRPGATPPFSALLLEELQNALGANT